MYPSKDHSPPDLSLFKLTAKVLFLLAALTAKTVSDLVLFSVDSSLCHVTDECIVLQTQFGSKTDRPGHRFLPVTLRKCEEEGLCPVSLQRANGAFTPSQRHSAAVHLAVHPPTVPPPAVHPPTVHSPAVHPPTREAGYTETVDGENDAGSRSDCISSFNEGHGATLRTSLSGTFLRNLPDLVTPLKGHSLSPRSCPATRSAPSERFWY